MTGIVRIGFVVGFLTVTSALAAQDTTVVPTLLSLGAQDSIPSITLAEALDRARRVQPALVQARGEVRTTGAAKRSSTGAFLPSLSLSGSSSRASSQRFNRETGQIVSVGTSTNYSGGLSMSLDLFDGFRRFAQRNAASANQAAAEASVVNQNFQVALTTKQAFFTAIANEELVRVSQARVQRAQQQLQISVDRFRAGAATRSDSLRSRVELGNAQLALIRAEAALATAQGNLGRQVGIEGRVRASPEEVVFERVAPVTIEELAPEALASSPVVVQAEAQARAAQSQVTVTRSQYWPTLSASYSNGYSGFQAPWSSTDSYVNNWNLRFSVSWTLFNGFNRESQMVSADVQRDNAEVRAADTRRQVMAQLVERVANLEAAARQIDISQASLIAAQEDLRVQQERYRVGAATILEVLTSQEALTTAEVDAIQSRYDYLIVRAQLEALIGRSL